MKVVMNLAMECSFLQFYLAFIILVFLPATKEDSVQQVLQKDQYLNKFIQLFDPKEERTDIALLMDESGSLTRNSNAFNIQKLFIEMIARYCIINLDHTRFSFITFGNYARVQADYINNPKGDICNFISKLGDVKIKGGFTNPQEALITAGKVLSGSSATRKYIVMLTDGCKTLGKDPVPTAENLRRQGIVIFGVAIGKSCHKELKKLITSSSHVYTVKSETESTLKELIAELKTAKSNVYLVPQTSNSLCNKLCKNGKNCCDENAECGCDSGGDYKCFCQPGTTGSGYSGKCLRCPRGTYSASGKTKCQQCPLNSNTTFEGAASIKACKCNPGFSGFPERNRPCEFRKCPKLRPPVGGLLVPPYCGRNLNDSCAFWCRHPYCPHNGNEVNCLERNSRKLQPPRICMENREWSGPEMKCEEAKCTQPPTITGIRYKCDSSNLKIGTKCYIKCDEGYSPDVEDSFVECASNSTWVGFAACSRSKCKPLKVNFKVITHPNECSKMPQAIGTKCMLSCTNGYKLLSKLNTNIITCGKNAKWNHVSTAASCQDEFGPTITCPPPVTVFNDPLKKTTLVDWTAPSFTDNDNYPPMVTSMNSSITSPHFFEIGTHKLIYTAVDVNGLSSSCEFTVTVLDVESPMVKYCPEDQEHYATGTSKQIFWAEPEFWDNSGHHDIKYQTAKSGEHFGASESHNVVYEVSDLAGNTFLCQFFIHIKPYRCLFHPPPSNGAITCSAAKGNGEECTVSCNPGHEFIDKSNGNFRYQCKLQNGNYEWLQNGQAVTSLWPNCAEITAPGGGILEGRINFLTDNCVDMTDEELAKMGDELRVKLRDDSPICNTSLICDVTIDSSLCMSRPAESVRRKRESDYNYIYSFDFQLKFDVNNYSAEVTDKQIFPLSPNVLQPFYVVVGNNENPVFHNSITLECNMAQLTDNNECLKCPIGTYFDTISASCTFCPLNTYQDTEGSTECKSCPVLTFTTEEGAVNVNQCRAPCEIGEYSKTGFMQCMACPIGTYQNETGQISCKKCDEGKTTWSVGAYAEDQCSTACTAGHYSTTGYEPCMPCPLGFFQNSVRSTDCIRCGNSFTTLEVATFDASECLDINPCEPNPCFNNGECSSKNGKVTCVCATGFFGTRCDIEINHCDIATSCLNGGTCINNHEGYTCNCLDGYSGFYCEIKRKLCDENTCLNGGRCIDNVIYYDCECADGFSGKNCEKNIDDCVPGACQNGGTCYDSGKALSNQKFYCCCAKGYTGPLCDRKVECESIYCKNGGTCVSNVCICKSGFTGRLCEVKIDHCLVDPCFNKGTCTSGEHYFTCHCAPGFRGNLCEFKQPLDYDVDFQTRDTDLYALLNTSKDLNALTISFWMKVEPDNEYFGTPISYSYLSPVDGKKEPNGLTFYNVNELVIYLHGVELQTTVRGSEDRKWHHYVFTWDSFNGIWGFYKDGELVAAGSGVGTGIPLWKGVMVVGQDQNSLGGGFRQIDSFKGRLSQINLWDFAMALKEVQQLHRSCGYIGNVFGWSDFETQFQDGRFTITQPSEKCSTMNSCGQYIRECHCHHMNILNSTLCENRLETCNPNPCLNDQLCRTVNNVSFCDCNGGYEGKFCQYDINECVNGNNDCSHQCINRKGSYTCTCPKGYKLDSNFRTCKSLRQCLYKGLLYGDKEEWDDGCEKCACIKGNVKCRLRKCREIECLPPFTAVRNPKDCCPSCIQHAAVCTITQNLFTTFDGILFAHTGDCQDILAQDCSQDRFSIQLRILKLPSTQKILVIRFECTILELTIEGDFLVNGESRDIPFESESQKFRIDSGKGRNAPKFLLTTEDGVTVSWYRNEDIKIHVPKTMFKQMCGLCGDYNGDQMDDTQIRNYTVVDTLMEFAQNWKVESVLCPAPLYHHPGLPSSGGRIGACANGWKFATDKCASLRSSAFHKCYDVLDPQESYDYCIQDACKCTESLCHCDAIHKYIAECQKLNITIDGWIGQDICGKRCLNGTVFVDCGPACPETCDRKEEDDPRCKIESCRAGCHCPADMVLHEGYCTLPEDCP